MSNVAVAVKTMRHNQFATSLMGTRRHEMTIGDAVRGFTEGILDGYARFRTIADVVTDDKGTRTGPRVGLHVSSGPIDVRARAGSVIRMMQRAGVLDCAEKGKRCSDAFHGFGLSRLA